MSQTNATTNEIKSPLDAAQKIVTELHGMTKDNQTLALKFAMETLRLEVALSSTVLPSAFHPPTAPPAAAAATDAPGQSSNIKSFAAAKAPKSDQQFATVVAYFYQFEAKPTERKAAIDPEIMKEAARLAGWPQVKRWAMTLTNAKNAGYLDPSGDGKFRLSSVGENLVAITLPGDAPAGKGSSGRTRKKHKKTKKSNKGAK